MDCVYTSFYQKFYTWEKGEKVDIKQWKCYTDYVKEKIMRAVKKIALFVAVSFIGCIPILSNRRVQAATDLTITTGTGYTSASDVDYIKQSGYIVNWGARGEDCTFLSTYAQSFYTGSYTYDILSQSSGGSSQSNAPSSSLYSALQSMMKTKHSHQTSYDETRYQYCYVDCEKNNYSQLSCFYSGEFFSSTWDAGATWNREHVWPRSKCINKNKKEDSADIIMLRPTVSSENSSRGNKAYGKSGGYYTPSESIRGDCARVVLYGYTRWGNTANMWGTNGVIENLNVLLEWMEADPVDTWEMGRNDAVQAITGTRNVFVDYPEFAWQLFGRSVPSNISTPSGIAKAGGGSSGNSSSENGSATEGEECNHEFGQWFELYPATEEWEGVEKRFCKHCDKTESRIIPPIAKEGCSGTVSILTSVSAVLGACALVFVKKEEKK